MSKRPEKSGSDLLGVAARAMQSGRIAVAARHVRQYVRQRPDDPVGLHMLGVILYQQGKADEAADCIGRAIDAGSSDASHLANWGLALKAAGRLDEALSAYERSVAKDPTVAGVWNDRGNTLMRLGRLKEAETSFRRSLELNGQDAGTHVNLGGVLLVMGRPDAAIEANRQAISLAPQLAPAYNGLASALSRKGDIEGAIEAYESAIRLDARSLEALGNLAALYEELSRLDEARRTAEQALSAVAIPSPHAPPHHAHAVLVLTKCDRREGRFQAGLDRLGDLDVEQLPDALARDIAFEQSRLYDRLDDPSRAFAAMTHGNLKALSSEGVDETLGDRFLNHIAALRAWSGPGPAITSPDIGDDHVDPVFLVGFPRSGTTLLGQILDRHSGLHLIEERPMLDTVIAKMRSDYGGYPAVLNDEQIRDLRHLYFRQVAGELPDGKISEKGGVRIVDKFPLHLINVGLIRTLFPGCRIVFAVRHPCDVVLSCFMQNFRPNPAMANFYSTDRAAVAYDRVLDLWTHLEATLKPDFHQIRYEDVIADFDTKVGGLLKYLGLPWQDSVRDYAVRARQRGRIDTPSYHQVTEAIYTRARYRWLRYEPQLSPVLEILQPWIRKFGYDQTGQASNV